jgi:hypothetical protein
MAQAGLQYPLASKKFPGLLGKRGGGDIPIMRFDAYQGIAHTASDYVRRKSPALQTRKRSNYLRGYLHLTSAVALKYRAVVADVAYILEIRSPGVRELLVIVEIEIFRNDLCCMISSPSMSDQRFYARITYG